MKNEEKFKYVWPTKEYEKQAIDYVKEFEKYNSNINGVGGLQNYLEDYDGWLKFLIEKKNRIANEQHVPSETFFLVRDNDNKIVGTANIRLALNEKLKKFGGNIGYGIRPTERQKGYNKINLYLALLECQKNGIKEVFLDCDKENLASAKTIQALGGKFIREYYDEEHVKCIVQDYIIDVDESIKNNSAKYEKYIIK